MMRYSKMKLILWISIFILSISIALADLSIDPLTIDKAGFPGDLVEVQIDITNDGGAEAVLSGLQNALSLIGGSDSGTANLVLSSDPLTIPAGDTVPFTYSFTIPYLFADDYAAAYMITFNDTDYTQDLTLSIEEAPSLSISNPGTIETIQRLDEHASITFDNTGNTDLAVTISISDLTKGGDTLPASAFTFSESNFALDFEDSNTITLTISIPDNQATGTYTGTLTASHAGGDTTRGITVIVNQFNPGLSADPEEIRVAGGANESFSSTFTVENTGSAPLVDLDVSLAGLGDFSISFGGTNFNLDVGEEHSVTLSGTVPDNRDPDEYRGTITVSNADVSLSIPLKVKVVSQLIIDDVDVTISGVSDNNIKDGEEVSESAGPLDGITFDVKVKNRYGTNVDDETSDITNAFVRVTIEDIDDGDELEDESEDFEITASNTHTESLRFQVPLKVEQGTYKVIIYVEGDDGNDKTHTDTMQIEVRVKKEDHSLRLYTADIDRGTVRCNRGNNLDIVLWNLGSNDEEETFLSVRAEEFDFSVFEGPFLLDADPDDDNNIYDKSYPFTIPENLGPGAYQIELRAYYESDILGDYRALTVIVEDCDPDQPDTPEEPGEDASGEPAEPSEPGQIDVNKPSETDQSTNPQAPPQSSTRLIDTQGTRDPSSVGLLVAVNVILILVLVIVLVRMRKKSPPIISIK
ncbi:MAG: hypothetical protein ABIH34_04495 [Nanoarchaeota archaeon]